MIILPANWNLEEEYEGSYVFENNDHTFNVFIDYVKDSKTPYTISYEQLAEDYEIIEIESGTFTTSAVTLDEAKKKAFLLMQFIDVKINGSEEEIKNLSKNN